MKTIAGLSNSLLNVVDGSICAYVYLKTFENWTIVFRMKTGHQNELEVCTWQGHEIPQEFKEVADYEQWEWSNVLITACVCERVYIKCSSVCVCVCVCAAMWILA